MLHIWSKFELSKEMVGNILVLPIAPAFHWEKVLKSNVCGMYLFGQYEHYGM